MTTPVWVQASAEGVTLVLHVQPGAKRTEVVGEHGDALKLRLAAPPVEGRANDCLLAFLAETLAVPRREVRLLSGDSARRKRVGIAGLSVATVVSRLGFPA